MTLPAKNPNWPELWAEGAYGGNPLTTAGLTVFYTNMSPRLQKQWSVRRGKQFELDQVQPAEFNGEWANKDGMYDPTNTSSPLAGNVLPYRVFRLRAQYPASTNLFDGDVATGGELSIPPGTTSASDGNLVGINSAYGTVYATSSTTAWQGSQVWQVNYTVASGDPSGNPLFQVFAAGASPNGGETFTFSVRVRCVTTGASPVVSTYISWARPNGTYFTVSSPTNVTLTGSPTASWVTLTQTATMPTPDTFTTAVASVRMVTVPGVDAAIQCDGLQWEANSTATSFVVPGRHYSVYHGAIERYPQAWDYTGTYGVVRPVCVDVMAILSQTILKSAFVMDVINTTGSGYSLDWFFKLDEPSGATNFSEEGGRVSGQGVLYNSPAGAGSITTGNAITAATLPGGKFYGTNGPVVTVNNPTAGQGTVIDLTPTGITAPSTGVGFTRMIAFRCGMTTGAPVIAAYTSGRNPNNALASSNMYIGLQVSSGTNMVVWASFYNAAGQNQLLNHTSVVNDNNWHLALVSLDAAGTTITINVDGVAVSATGTHDLHQTVQVNESVGGDLYKVDNSVGFANSNYIGDLALYAQWTGVVDAGVQSNLFARFKNAYITDSAYFRFFRILNWANYTGSSTVDVSMTTSMNYANDIEGVDALTALQDVVTTENGRMFVDGKGYLVFQSRQRGFQQGTIGNPSGPMWVFGENPGEIPYTDVSFDFDPTRVSNQIAVTQNSTGTVYGATDTTSQQNYGVRSFSRSSQATDPEEVRESAFHYLSRYKDVNLRIASLKVNPAANPSLFPSVLSFEIGQYVQINRRDPAGVRPTITLYGFIEQITHSGDDNLNWETELEISPAPAVPYATFTSLRTTLNTSAAAGQPTITINALPDAATNPVRSELTDGQQLTISGGGNSELLTITTGGVQDALAGYTTATITFTTNLVHSYSSGASVVEATGANFDTLAAFDGAWFSY